MKKSRSVKINQLEDGHRISFNAMASPCEILIQTLDKALVQQIAQCISQEVWRIEDKYSRYNPHSLCSKINNSAGARVTIDEETYLLLNFADQCYELSDGLFDISSGILNNLWVFKNTFDDSQKLPTPVEINEILSFVGWKRVVYEQCYIELPNKMALDFGGIGKEYAVDRSILLAKALSDTPILVNLGGDLAVTGPRFKNKAWQVAIEHPESDTFGQKQDMIVALKQGALATSGDTRRYLIKNGKRYGHVLNAKTGWPVVDAPRSITTVAPQCIQAGVLSTLALLQGKHAEQFLTMQEVKYWARR